MSTIKKIAGRLEKSLEQASETCRLVGEIILGIIVLLIVVDVILRYFFNQPLSYSFELIEAGLSMVIFFGIVICTAHRGHVDISLLVGRFSPRVQAAIMSFSYIIGSALFGLVAWQMFSHTMQTMEMGKVTSILRIPSYPFVFIIGLCCVLISLLLLAQFIHLIRKALAK